MALYKPTLVAQNFLVNSGFDFWQAGTSATVTATGGATPTNTYLYQADQWYVNNILGGGTVEGVITYSQVAGVTNGSKYGAKVQITTAPTGTGIQNGCELYQPLSNQASYDLYNQTASFSILVKSLGNVTQVGVQFFYATSEAKLTTAIGSEVLTTVNTSTFTACTINGQALGTAQGVGGIIGVRIRPTAVSAGNLYDLNNGFICEQAILNKGTLAAAFSRQAPSTAIELDSCQYFYQVMNTAGASTGIISIGLCTVANTTGQFALPTKQTMRIAPTMTVSAAGHFTVANASASAAATAFAQNTTTPDTATANFTLSGTYAANSSLNLQYSNASARIYIDARI